MRVFHVKPFWQLCIFATHGLKIIRQFIRKQLALNNAERRYSDSHAKRSNECKCGVRSSSLSRHYSVNDSIAKHRERRSDKIGRASCRERERIEEAEVV